MFAYISTCWSFMPYEIADLRILEMDSSDLNLSEENLKKKMRRQWAKLCLRFHPDRSPGHASEFQAVMGAYNRLTDIAHVYEHDIHAFFARDEVHIPDTAVDLIQQEGIAMAYEAILHRFSSLRTEQAKRAYAQHYADFINLAESLERRHEELNYRRGQWLYQQQEESLRTAFYSRMANAYPAYVC